MPLSQSIDCGAYYALLKIKGKQKKKSLKTNLLPEARRRLAQYRRDMERIDPCAGKISVEGLCDRYLETVGHQAPRTIRRKTDIVNRIKGRWGSQDASRVKKSEVQAWLSSYPFGEVSYNLHLETVRAVFAVAVDDRILAYSPVEGVKAKKRQKPVRDTPTEGEFAAIVSSIREQKYADTAKESADFVELMGLVGLGQAEISSLTWGDVDFQKGRIATFRQKTKTGFYVPLFNQARPLLERMYAEAKENGRARHDDKVFSISDPKVALASACKRLNFKNYSSRAFRRMFITIALERTGDVKTISEWQGHQDGGVLILNTYSHVRSGRSEEMAKLMS